MSIIKTLKEVVHFLKVVAARVAYSLLIFMKKLQKKQINVLNLESSLAYINSHRVSVGRYGDGEFKWMFQQREAENFEENSPALAHALIRVIKSQRNDFKVCIPDIFDGLSQYRWDDAGFWAGQLVKYHRQWMSVLSTEELYLDSLVTRPYMIYKNRTKSSDLFKQFRSMWDNRSVLLIEGQDTRFGIGNDLLSNAKKVERIVCPSVNAFESYSEILKASQHYINTVDKEDLLVLTSLGPCATVLAFDLSATGTQVIDIGHLDVEYSWYLLGVTHKTDLPYKYVNEVEGGEKVGKMPLNDEKLYKSQIVKRII